MKLKEKLKSEFGLEDFQIDLTQIECHSVVTASKLEELTDASKDSLLNSLKFNALDLNVV